MSKTIGCWGPERWRVVDGGGREKHPIAGVRAPKKLSRACNGVQDAAALPATTVMAATWSPP